MLNRQSTRRGEAAYGVLVLPPPDPEFAKYTASPSNSGSRPKRHRVQSRAQIHRRNGWCTALLVILCCSVLLVLSGCGGVLVNAVDSETLKASPNSVSFGAVSVGQTASTAVSLVNGGSAPVEITQLNLTGQPFSVNGVSELPITVAAGGAYNFSVKFSPAATGAATGQLMIASNASSNGTMAIGLSGTGAAASTTTLSSLSCTSSALIGLAADPCTVTLNAAAGSGGLTVSLASSNSAVTVPS